VSPRPSKQCAGRANSRIDTVSMYRHTRKFPIRSSQHPRRCFWSASLKPYLRAIRRNCARAKAARHCRVTHSSSDKSQPRRDVPFRPTRTETQSPSQRSISYFQLGEFSLLHGRRPAVGQRGVLVTAFSTAEQAITAFTTAVEFLFLLQKANKSVVSRRPRCVWQRVSFEVAVASFGLKATIHKI